jgi:hypothetical protein
METTTTGTAVPELAARIAAELGHEYTLELGELEHYREVRGPGFARLGIGRDWNNRERARRLRISAEFPKTQRGESMAPYHRDGLSITVSRDKTPAAIARDIRRRLIPAAAHAWQEAETRRREHNRTNDEAAALAAELAGILAMVPRQNDGRADGWNFYTSQGGQLTVNAYGGVRAELRSCGPEFAVELARLLAKHKEA